jgi:hypothetical protein
MKTAVAGSPDNSFTDKIQVRQMSGEEKSLYLTVKQDEIPTIILVSGKSGEEANGDSEVIGRLVNLALGLGVKPSVLASVIKGIDGGLYGVYQSKPIKSKADVIAIALENL